MELKFDSRGFKETIKDIINLASIYYDTTKPFKTDHVLISFVYCYSEGEDGVGESVIAKAVLKNPDGFEDFVTISIMGAPQAALKELHSKLKLKTNNNFDLNYKSARMKERSKKSN
mgnify:CR=1|jgi:hypothetical protein